MYRKLLISMFLLLFFSTSAFSERVGGIEYIDAVMWTGGVDGASSCWDPNYTASNMVNGNGLDANTGAHVSSNYGNMWLTNGEVSTAYAVIDLQAEYDILALRIWNYNEAGQTGRGIKSVDILVAGVGFTFTNVGTFEFDQATGDNTDFSQALSLVAAGVQYVQLQVNSKWDVGSAPGTGLSEIRVLVAPQWDVSTAYSDTNSSPQRGPWSLRNGDPDPLKYGNLLVQDPCTLWCEDDEVWCATGNGDWPYFVANQGSTCWGKDPNEFLGNGPLLIRWANILSNTLGIRIYGTVYHHDWPWTNTNHLAWEVSLNGSPLSNGVGPWDDGNDVALMGPNNIVNFDDGSGGVEAMTVKVEPADELELLIDGSGPDGDGTPPAFIASYRLEVVPICGDNEHPYPPQADLNSDCIVDLSDFSIIANLWLVCTKPECGM